VVGVKLHGVKQLFVADLVALTSAHLIETTLAFVLAYMRVRQCQCA
jgi:hypothetical protein